MHVTWRIVRLWEWRLLKVVVLASVIGGIVYWFRFAPIPISRARVTRGVIIAEVMGTGTLEARIKATISPKISGRIGNVWADHGDRVTAGKRLVRLDDTDWRQQVALAAANRDTAQAAIRRLETDQQQTRAVLEQARKTYSRVHSLFTSQAGSREAVDRATEALAVAEAGLSRAQAAVTEGQKERIAAEKALDYHRARLTDTEIVAPFDGLIVRRHRDPGDVVVPGSAILTLISTDDLWITTWVDETEMAKLHEGQRARVVFRSEPDRSYPGTVARLGKEADRETREFVVDVRVLMLPTNWAVGQRAEIFIETNRKDDALLLPVPYISRREQATGVFVDVEGTASWRPLTVGIRGRETVEVVDGLAADEVVVRPLDPRTPLTAGRRVVTP
jgi:HlyD family secretion protein